MKYPGLLLALVTAFSAPLFAQVQVSVVMEQTQFLPNESIPLAVRIRNSSGQTLRFGKEEWLSYVVEARDGFQVAKTEEPPSDHEFELPTSKVATQRSNLQPYYSITKPGGYTVTARVHLKDWDMDVVSEPHNFEIVRGVKLWEREFGVPQSSAPNEPPEVRKYILQKATYLHSLRLYLRVTDPKEERSFRVLQVGTMVSFSNPTTLLDQRNNLHVLYEEGARTFNFTVANPDGELLARRTYYITDTSPRLKLNDQGRVEVIGGMRREAATDYPPAPPTVIAPIAIPKPSPAPTNNVVPTKR